MVRPKKWRRVGFEPDVTYFKPAGVRIADMEEVKLSIEGVEALRLCDYEGLNQEEAAKKMKVSQPTLHRLLKSARKRVTEALVSGKAMRIEGGVYKLSAAGGYRLFNCFECGNSWKEPYGTGPKTSCPECKSSNIKRKS